MYFSVSKLPRRLSLHLRNIGLVHQDFRKVIFNAHMHDPDTKKQPGMYFQYKFYFLDNDLINLTSPQYTFSKLYS